MKLEQQVCSLELSKRLKELGVKQDSLYAWVLQTANKSEAVNIEKNPSLWLRGAAWDADTYASAFTVAELGEMFEGRELPFYDNGEWKSAGYCELPTGRERITADTEAEARAKTLINLLENKLISV